MPRGCMRAGREKTQWHLILIKRRSLMVFGSLAQVKAGATPRGGNYRTKRFPR